MTNPMSTFLKQDFWLAAEPWKIAVNRKKKKINFSTLLIFHEEKIELLLPIPRYVWQWGQIIIKFSEVLFWISPTVINGLRSYMTILLETLQVVNPPSQCLEIVFDILRQAVSEPTSQVTRLVYN